uniref:Uncharacterized protein n=1 Tax=Oryzias latipes TaxID=8090 RepID=A0A3P9K6S8_ORYLA
MFEWTDAERSAITSLWGKIDVGEIGQQALTGEPIICTNSILFNSLFSVYWCDFKHLIMYPWTQRHFALFGNLSTNAVILGNPKVGQHGKVVKWAGERSEEHGQHQEHLHQAQSSTWILTTSGLWLSASPCASLPNLVLKSSPLERRRPGGSSCRGGLRLGQAVALVS